MSRLQSETYQAHSIEIRKFQEENREVFRKMKKEMEDMLIPLLKKSTTSIHTLYLTEC
jgi:hypothetical protein